ncbi:MAG: gliding motility-associated ABC transporter substrate-binding protein GldG [Flavobacteriaceae bacterium]|nr:gliding motility-associated ABC transporter substrate-binding protein GldG [Flavobacteriaceae bacterium]
MKTIKNNIGLILIALIILIGVNLIAGKVYKRFDITEDQRFTLSDATIDIVNNVEEEIMFDVLLKGNFPAEFKRLQLETRQLLEEFSAVNPNIQFNFVNPLQDEANPEQLIQSMIKFGLTPANVTVQENGKTSNETIFPWAIVNLGERSVRIPLLRNAYGTSDVERVNNSVQQLEYAFADGLKKLTLQEKKSLAVLKGHGELDDKYLVDYLKEVGNYYRIGAFNLDSLANDSEKTLENLKRFDAMLVAKPTEKFNDRDKYILDQYIMGGGKSMWLMDAVAIDLDSLNNEKFSNVTFPRDLNLNDLFFKYGIRINYNLVKDFSHTPAVVISRNGEEVPVEWLYSPLVQTNENHPLTTNLNLVKLEFANQIDTLKNSINKTILLKSSPKSKLSGAPAPINLFEFQKDLDESTYTNGDQNLGVLLEGEFTSGFKNRVKPIKLKSHLDQSQDNKMIVIADGDIVNYNTSNKQPLLNGVDRWTNQIFGNKDFLMNSINYLLDDNGLINIRSKEVKIGFLNKEKAASERTKWQLINILLPLLLLGLFGGLNYLIRKKKYT